MGKRVSFETKYKILMQKTYFDTGFNLINYAKYFIYIFGAASFLNKWSMKWTGLLFIGYGVLCYILGWLWYHSDFILAGAEIGNRYNPLAWELRSYMNGDKKRKH